MLARELGTLGGAAAVTQSIVHAARVQRATVGSRGVLVYSPAYRNNPYTELLYRGAWDAGVVPLPLPSVHSLEALECLEPLRTPSVLHLHWTNQLIGSDRQETIAAHEEFRRRIEGLRAAGTSLVWTIHNHLPHECPDPDLELELRRWLVDTVDRIHVMGPATADVVGDLYPLDPEKVRAVPHPSYQGVYPDTIVRDQARYELGLVPDEVVMVVFGGIRAYKRLDLALDALDALRERGRRVRLLVAGQWMRQWEGSLELQARLLEHPYVDAALGRVAEVNVQRYLRAADLMLLPQVGVLNSGALMLGTTFGLPVVGSVTGEIGPLIERTGVGATFESADGDGIAEAVETVLDRPHARLREATDRLTAETAPTVLGERFMQELVTPLLERG